MLLTISDDTSVKKLVNPRYQTVRLMRGAPADASDAGRSRAVSLASRGPRKKISAQSMLYMGVRVGRGRPREGLLRLPIASGGPDAQGRMAFGDW